MSEMLTLETMEWYHWLLLIVPSVLLFIGMPLYLLWWGRRPDFPDGKRIEKKRGRYKVHTVSQYTDNHPDVALADIADMCALAVWATGEAWRREINKEAWEEIEEVCIYFADDDYFENQPWTHLETAAAFLVNTGANVGSGLPMAVIRASLVKHVINTGEPVIHEMCHALLRHYTEPGRDRQHTDPSVWEESGGAASVQHEAGELFVEHA